MIQEKSFRHWATFVFWTFSIVAFNMALVSCQAQSNAPARAHQDAEAPQLPALSEPSLAPTTAAALPRTAVPTTTLEPLTIREQHSTPVPRLDQTTQSMASPVPSSSVSGADQNEINTEIEAAGQIIPIPKVALPNGPRKAPPVRLIIPSIGIDARVIALSTHYTEQGELVWDTAPFAAGHHAGTANPGESGNVVISGHISSLREGAVFKRLPEIHIGDGLVIVTRDRNYLYQVVDQRIVEPQQVDVMSPTAEETVTLITCVPDGVYTHRLIVRAKRI